ncbi:MAG: hypothetical protein HRU36_01695 [Rickettsiales bacterium]|nr:hypothetical protein [Rickettsiales bacterium]
MKQAIISTVYMAVPTTINIIWPSYGAVIYKIAIAGFATYGLLEKINILYQNNYGNNAMNYEIESSKARYDLFKICADVIGIDWCKIKVQQYADIVEALNNQMGSKLIGEILDKAEL